VDSCALSILKGKIMAKKLYVGGLSYDTTEETLKKTFAEVGTVETAVIINDRESGRSKGFGFVEMSTEDEAKKAIETFNGKELDGRSLIVNEARPQEERPRSGGYDRGGSGGGYGGNRGGRY
jgi:RNA recognition motif-containing protein